MLPQTLKPTIQRKADAAIAAGKLTKEEILAKLTELVETSVETSRGEVEALKQGFTTRSVVTRWKSSRRNFIADGGEERILQLPLTKPRTRSRICSLL